MRRSEVWIMLVLLTPAVLSTPLQLKGAPLLLRSQVLSQDEIERAVVRLENGDESEYGELMETEERSEDGETTLTLTSPSREMELKLRPSYRLIKPFARLTIVDGDEECEFPFDPSLRTSFYHGSVSGSPKGMVSLVRSKDGWNGMIMTDSQRYVVHGVRGSSRALLLPMSTEDEEFYNGYRILDAEDREQEYNRTGDESFSRVQEYNMTGDESFSRSSDSEFEMELAVYTDEDLYKFVQNKYPNENTKQKVQEIALIAVNTIHVAYQKPSIGNKINVVVAKMVMMTTNPTELHKNNKMETYLINYCRWDAEKQNPGGTKYDLGLMLSGIDMYGDKPEDKGTLGMAPLGKACLHNTKSSCAIGEGITYGVGFTMAHEIGHNIGMPHDSVGNTCSKKGYIMGPFASPGAATWSTCSKDYLRKFLKSLDDFGLNCMRDKGTAAVEHSVEGKLPGERVKQGDQCRFAFGEGWTEDSESEDFCASTWCEKDGDYKSADEPPLPGTYCGSGKICWDGHCSDRDTVINKIKAYTPTKSGSTGKALPLDELCKREEPEFPTAVTYERIKSVITKYPDISSMCSEGMVCESKATGQLIRAGYAAPPGTSCAAGKVCKNFACVGSGGSTGSSGGSTGGSSKAGESLASLDQFCQKMLTSGSAKGQQGSDCTKAKCRLGDKIYTIPVYNTNICKSGQICDNGRCVSDTGMKSEGALSGSMLTLVNGLCGGHFGAQYTAFCTRENLFMYPNQKSNCRNDMCYMLLCLGDNGGGSWSIHPFTPPDGTSCGNGKTCNWYQCQ